MANINQRPSFLIEDLLECHKRLEEAKRQRAREYEAEMQRNLEQFYQMSHHSSSFARVPPSLILPHTTSGHFINLPTTSYLAPKTDVPMSVDYRRFSAGELPQTALYSQHFPHLDGKGNVSLLRTLYFAPLLFVIFSSCEKIKTKIASRAKVAEIVDNLYLIGLIFLIGNTNQLID